MAKVQRIYRQSATKKSNEDPNIIAMPLRSVLLFTTVDAYEMDEPTPFYRVGVSKRNEILDIIASDVVHIFIDPLDYDLSFLNQVKQKCMNAKRLTIDGNLEGINENVYKRNVHIASEKIKRANGGLLFESALTFVRSYNQIEELFFGSDMELIDKIYTTKKWGFGRRIKSNGKFVSPTFSTEILINLNPNLKMISFIDYDEVDPYDLRDMGSVCSSVMNAMKISKPSQLEKLECCPMHICLNQVTNLRVLSTGYFSSGFHSDTLVELVLKTLSGDYKVHQMFPNLKKLRVKMFCPFVMDMSGTLNAGLYDGVVLDEIEVEEQIPCFCCDMIRIDSNDALLQMALHHSFRSSKSRVDPNQSNKCTHDTTGPCKYVTYNSTKTCNHYGSPHPMTNCLCTDVTSIGLFKTLKTIRFRCFDGTVARFVRKLQQVSNETKIIVHEESRFERNFDHHSLWDNLDELAKTLNLVPHDKIEIVMKKATGIKLRKIKAKLSYYIPADVKVSFSD